MSALGQARSANACCEEDEMSSKTLPMKLIAVLGSATLVFLVGCGGNTSQPPPPSQTAVNNPIPAISNVFPTATAAGGPAFTLAVGGVNFVSSSVVRWNGSDRPTAFVNSGGVTAQIPAGDIAATGTAAITVFNPGGASSNSVAFSIGVGPVSVAVAADPSGKFGKFVYVANANSNNVSMYTIDATTGALTSTGTIAAGTSPSSLAVDPSGKFAYVANAYSNNVSMYTINVTTGVLTSIGAIGAGEYPDSLGVDPSGKFAYVANANSFSVSMYTIDATTGVLTSIGEIGAGWYPDSVVVHPSGKFAYVANYGDGLGGTPGSVSMYRINADGGLSSTGTIAEAYVGTTYVAVHPSGKFAYVASPRLNSSISTYTIDATTGTLTSTATIAGAIESTTSMAVHPSGKFAYMTNAGSSNTISMYTINATTGALTSTGTIAAGTLPKSVAVDPSGKFAYVANNFSNSISMYTIDATTGALTLIRTIGM